MSPLVDELPNIEAAVNMVAAAAGLRAYSSIPGRPEYPLIVSMRLGGAPGERHRLSGARVQVEAWGDKDTDKSTVLDTCRTAWKALLEAEGETVELSDGERVLLSGVNPEVEPQWLPDPRTARPRYIFSMRIYCRQVDPS